jgi:hypothetical protein
MEFNDAAYRLDAFPPTETDNAGSASSQQKTKDDTGSKSSEKKTKQYKTFTPVDVDTLPVPQRIKNLIRGKDDPKHPYSSRSEPVMAVLVAMASAGCSDVLMTDVMFDISLPLGKHVREQSNPEKYAARQIQQARKAATDPDVAKLNEQYALIIVGDKIAILQTEPDLSEPDSIERDSFKLLQLSAFNQWHENQFVTRGDKNLPLAKFWLKHPQRRQYKGMVFAPTRKVTGHFNLWRGFAVKSKPGDCSKFLAHIKDNVCQGSDELYRWVIGCSHRSLSIRTKR